MGGMNSALLVGLLKGAVKTGIKSKFRFQGQLTRRKNEPLYTEHIISLPRLGI